MNTHETLARAKMSPEDEQASKNPDKLVQLAKIIPGLGIILSLLSGSAFAASGFAIEMMPNVDSTCAVVYRSLAQLVVYGAIAIKNDAPLMSAPGERKYVAIRALGGFVTFSASYYAFRFMTFSDVNTITMSSALLVAPLAFFFLREPCGLAQCLLIVITLIGIVLVARPSTLFGSSSGAAFSPADNAIGALLAFAAALGVAASTISVRKCSRTSASVIIAWFSLTSVLLSIGLLVLLKVGFAFDILLPSTPSDWLWLNLNALFGIVNQCLFMWSLQLEGANVVSLLKTFEIVLAFALQVAFLEQPIFWTSVLGAVVVCSSVAVICLQRIFESRSNNLPSLSRRANSSSSLIVQ